MTRLDTDMNYAAVIPALDAAPWIGDVVHRTVACLPRVLVVDDGSSDETGRLATAAGAEVLRHPTNRGKGFALHTGFSRLFAEGFDGVVSLDADGQHLPEEIPRLLEVAGGADLVLGSRHHLFAEMAGVRRWSNRLSSRTISSLAGLRVPDVQTGFRVYSRSLWEGLRFPTGRFDSESSILVKAARHGFEVRYVPVALGFVDGRHTSHYRPLIDSLAIARAVVAARFSRRTERWAPLVS